MTARGSAQAREYSLGYQVSQVDWMQKDWEAGRTVSETTLRLWWKNVLHYSVQQMCMWHSEEAVRERSPCVHAFVESQTSCPSTKSGPNSVFAPVFCQSVPVLLPAHLTFLRRSLFFLLALTLSKALSLSSFIYPWHNGEDWELKINSLLQSLGENMQT